MVLNSYIRLCFTNTKRLEDYLSMVTVLLTFASPIVNLNGCSFSFAMLKYILDNINLIGEWNIRKNLGE